jgi:hypothetical protein
MLEPSTEAYSEAGKSAALVYDTDQPEMPVAVLLSFGAYQRVDVRPTAYGIYSGKFPTDTLSRTRFESAAEAVKALNEALAVDPWKWNRADIKDYRKILTLQGSGDGVKIAHANLWFARFRVRFSPRQLDIMRQYIEQPRRRRK